MQKRAAATVIMLLGIAAFLLETFVLRLEGAGGICFRVLAVLFALGGLIALCVFNRRNGKKIEGLVEAGTDFLDIVLDIFFGM